MSKLIGNKPNQVPTNGDLGTMAYMDYDAVAPVLLGRRRNLIINGAMQVWQRGTSQTSLGYGSVDRWRINGNLGSGVTVSRSTEVPPNLGFTYSMRLQATDAPDCYPWQNVENAINLMKGRKVTFSWYAKEVSGTTNNGPHFVELPTWTAIYPSSNTTENIGDGWIRRVVTWDLTSWTPQSGNVNAAFRWDVSENTAVDVYVTGVQLELGSVATPFEHRSYGEELALCQRYYEIADFYIRGAAPYSGRIGSICNFSVAKRAAPSISFANIYVGGTVTGVVIGSAAGIAGVGVATDPLTSTTSGTLRCAVIADAEL